MKRNLDQICNVSSGIVTRRKEANGEVVESYKLLTLKSINDEGYIDMEYLEDFDSNDTLDSKYITSIGDVIVRLSYPYTVFYINEEYKGIVVSSHCLILRGFSNEVMPEYVSLYLNSETQKRRINKYEYGSAVKMLKASQLREMKINIPTLKEQQELTEISKLYIDEKRLLQKLISERSIQLKGIQQRYFGGAR